MIRTNSVPIPREIRREIAPSHWMTSKVVVEAIQGSSYVLPGLLREPRAICNARALLLAHRNHQFHGKGLTKLGTKVFYVDEIEDQQSTQCSLLLSKAYGNARPVANLPALDCIFQHIVLSMLTNSHLAVAW